MRVKLNMFYRLLCCFMFLMLLATHSSAETIGEDQEAVTPIDCSLSQLPQMPIDPSERGPFVVGSRTVTIGDMKCQMWYPAVNGSEAGKEVKVIDLHDLQEYMPDVLVGENPDDYPKVVTDFYIDLPLDNTHGKYPVVIYIHGGGCFRWTSSFYCSHWASRGFVVFHADYPYMNMGDLRYDADPSWLRQILIWVRARMTADTRKMISDLRSPNPTGVGIDFIKPYVDTYRMGIIGFSEGGWSAGRMGNDPGVRVVATLPLGEAERGDWVESVLVMIGTEDSVISPTGKNILNRTTLKTAKNRFYVLPNAGHMVFANACSIIEYAPEYGIDMGIITPFANNGCGPEYLDELLGWEMVEYATTGVLEETLTCSETAAAQLDLMDDKYDGVKYKFRDVEEETGE